MHTEDLEDDRSIMIHLNIMQKEVERMRPDYVKIKDSMERTVSARKQAFRTKQTAELLVEFPFLKLPNLVNIYMYLYTTINF